jgi:predicted nucleic acid-binding protein
MTVFLDTSAIYALFDRDDSNHSRARTIWRKLLESGAGMTTTNYVLVEAFALVQHRLGLAAARALREDFLPVVSIAWIGESTHRAAMDALLTSGRRTLSLVDCASFEVMRQLGIKSAFAFDRHFTEQGFPGPLKD